MYSTGLLASLTDANNQTTTVSWDTMGRPLSFTYPTVAAGTPATTFNYSDSTNTVTRTILATPDPTQTTTVIFDAFGREIHRSMSDTPQADTVDTTYDADGRVATVSNPYRTTSDPTYGLTTNAYDALGRMTVQTQPDGSSQLKWSYTGPTTTSINELGIPWTRKSDALGRLSSVVEPGGVPTAYGYDPLGNLLNVTQSGVTGETPRARSFTYDSLSRLLTAANPETGTISYGYDLNGNVTGKTDARGFTTIYGYDALNRNTSRSSSAPGAITSCFSYDGATVANGIGRITDEWTQIGSASCSQAPSNASLVTHHSIFAYDAMGRITNDQRCTVAGCTQGRVHILQYQYDLAGDRTSFNDGRGVTTFGLAYDAAGRLGQMTSTWSDITHPPLLFSVQNYSPVGIANWTLGNVLSLAQTYDSRTRVSSLSVQRSAQ